MQSGEVELFSRARAFLASRGYARNVRTADLVAVATLAAAQPAQMVEGAYNVLGGFAGPLTGEGSIPTSSSGVIIGSAMSLRFLETGDGTDSAVPDYQAIMQASEHIVRVAGTDVISRHGLFQGRFASMGSGIAAGPLVGTAQPVVQTRELEPLLVVKGGERVQQFISVLDALVLTDELSVLLFAHAVLADEGED